MSARTTIPQVRQLLHSSQVTTKAIDAFINNHSATSALRQCRKFTESRPHSKVPEMIRTQSLLSVSLVGSQKISVPPYVFNEDNGKSLVMIMHLGSDVCSHPGIIHGGLLATVLDETIAWCCFPRLPQKVGVTASLKIDYRNPAVAHSYVVSKAEITKREGRKVWLDGRIETLEADGVEPALIAEAKALCIEPKQVTVS
ncbi:hypothetical protein ACN42_g4919 [Penicillium freii]|uniref:Thioesterase domain-containing protein n=1 Tax=Penicillium freii TaxID=48697 RepID=A0A101MKE7_PENFR|nr:hypothetical protein ACN42_g4919 [Penicillium freii]